MTTFTSRIRAVFVLAIGAALGCSTDSDTTGPRGITETASLTVEAVTATAYVTLGSPAQTIVVEDSSTSSAWDMSFNATKVFLNGGDVGPGEVTGYCLCDNEALTNDEVMALTASGQASDFESVTAADIPSASSFSATVFADHPWYRYNLANNHQIWPMFHVYLIKRGSAVYKVQLISYYNASASPRIITFRYARIKS